MTAACLCRIFYILIRRTLSANADIFHDRIIKQKAVLRDIGNALVEIFL